ncbi:MAG: DUF2179 domain-containing protein [Desulfobacterales bacterium]|nr:DUF2179 domain-containing protein [Desulfobacterales bacterium]
MTSADWVTGLIIFFARVCDVSIGTVRTIVTVQGRTVIAFFLGFFEVIIWLVVVTTIVNEIKEKPLLVLFYGFGFATGNVAGILLERKLAFGMVIIRIITKKNGYQMAERLRKMGQPVTIFTGEGMLGPVLELYVVIRRRDLKLIIPIINEEDPDSFYITEQAGDVSKMLRPISQPVTGWRNVFKKK